MNAYKKISIGVLVYLLFVIFGLVCVSIVSKQDVIYTRYWMSVQLILDMILLLREAINISFHLQGFMGTTVTLYFQSISCILGIGQLSWMVVGWVNFQPANDLNGILMLIHLSITTMMIIVVLIMTITIHVRDETREEQARLPVKVCDTIPSDIHCNICLEDYVIGDNLTELSCGHVYHHECIKQWIEVSDSCPTCRVIV